MASTSLAKQVHELRKLMVKDYLKENSGYFSGLPRLFDIVKNSKRGNCKPVESGTDHGGEKRPGALF
jgi:hypothetical protein